MHSEHWKSSLISLLPAHSSRSNQSSSLKHFWTHGLPWWLRRWRLCPQCGRLSFDPWLGKTPWRREWQPTRVLALRIPWIEEAGGLEFMGSQRVRHNWATNSIILCQTHTYIHTRFSSVTTVLPKCMPLASLITISCLQGLPGGSAGTESACNVGNCRNLGSIPGLGRSPGEGNGYPLQYSGLGRKESDTTKKLSLSLPIG